MNFNPDISKQANEVAFSRKTNKVSHRSLTFDNMPVAQTNSQKHLGMQIDNTLNSMNDLFDFKVRVYLSKLDFNDTHREKLCFTQFSIRMAA